MDAWRRDNPDATITAIADASLLHHIDDPVALRAAIASGEIVVAPGDADDLILERAFALDALVVTRDNFLGKRRTYPDIQNDHTRFFAPRAHSGKIRFVARHMRVFTDDEIREAERKDLKKAKRADSEQLRKRYLCTSHPSTCPYGGQELPPHEPPVFRGGQPYCSRCDSVAEEVAQQDQDAGATKCPEPDDDLIAEEEASPHLRLVREPAESASGSETAGLEPSEEAETAWEIVAPAADPSAIEHQASGGSRQGVPSKMTETVVVAVRHAGAEIERIEVGREPIVLGRGSPHSNARCITTAIPKNAASTISREHLSLYYEDDALIVVHRAENNYSFLNPLFDAKGLPVDNRLFLGVEYVVEPGDSIVLGNNILTISFATD
jgi:hypothetical protein